MVLTRQMRVAIYGLLFPVAPGLCLDLNDHSVVDQPVNGRHGHYAVGKDLIPITERMVGGDDQAFCLIAMGDKLKEHMGFRLALFDIANVIENKNRIPVQPGKR